MSHYALHSPFDADPRFVKNYDKKYGNKAPEFAALVEGMDKSLGDIMNTLEELKISENTFIIFLGDNGSDAPLVDFTK